MSPMLREALALVGRGLPVAPLHQPVRTPGGVLVCSCPRAEECKSPAKHPRTSHGIAEASADPDQVTRWWSRWPAANIAIATGPARLIVADLDGEQAIRAWQELAAPHSRTVTAAVRTPRGWHFWFRQPLDGDPLGNSASRLAPGIDTRGAGGYVLAPPSLHITGRRYLWAPGGAQVAACPSWLAVALRPAPVPEVPARPIPDLTATGDGRRHRYLTAALKAELERVMDAQPGGRNDALNRAAYCLGQLVAGAGLDEDAVTGALTTAALAAGLSEAEAVRTIASGLAAGARTPRSATA